MASASPSPLRRAFGALVAASVVLAVVVRALGRPVALSHGAGALAAALVVARFALSVFDAARGRLPWTRLLFPALLGAEVVLYALGVDAGLAGRAALAAFELGALAFAIGAAWRAPRRGGAALLDERLGAALERVFPARLARILAVECTILRSVFARVRATTAPRAFGYADSSAMKLVVLAYPLMLLGDLFVVHALIPSRFVAVHVALTALSVYGFFWLLGVYRTMQLRPHVMGDGVLRVHRGVLATAIIPLDAIESAVALGDDAPARGAARFDVKGAPRVVVTTRAAIACRGFLRDTEARRIVVSADDPGALLAAIAPPAARGEGVSMDTP